jgi:hypothetical protein
MIGGCRFNSKHEVQPEFLLKLFLAFRCDNRIRIRIKKNTLHTRYTDKFVQEYPCVITRHGLHTHLQHDYEKKMPNYKRVDWKNVGDWVSQFATRKLEIRIRLDLNTAEEFMSVFKTIQEIANVSFVVKPTRFNPEKISWRKMYVCHHGGRSKIKQNG